MVRCNEIVVGKKTSGWKDSLSRKLSPLSTLITLLLIAVSAEAQLASPSMWMFPRGNMEATLRQRQPSISQSIDSMRVKWSLTELSGDIQPLVGNIIDDAKLADSLPYAPNEITAIVRGRIIVADAKGRIRSSSQVPPYVKSVSLLFDSSSFIPPASPTKSLIMGLQTVEHESLGDTLATAYLAGYNSQSDTVGVLSRLTADLRSVAGNYFAGITPVFGHIGVGETVMYSLVNQTAPKLDTSKTNYLRGVLQYNGGNVTPTFPLPDIGDSAIRRYLIAPETAFAQPSISFNGSAVKMGVPIFPTLTADSNNVDLSNTISALPTRPKLPYLMSVTLDPQGMTETFATRDVSSWLTNGRKRPRIRPVWVDVNDAGNGGQLSSLMLVAEEYTGRDSSQGVSRLHLYQANGDTITSLRNANIPPFTGSSNHLWSIAQGNVDGNDPNNALTPFYPNNPGNEIIVTQSTREFAYAGSKLFIFRYRTGTPTPKQSPRGAVLSAFDTILSWQVNGWVAGVNDIDGVGDGKEEIILADGNTLRVLRLRDYTDSRLRSGFPFDTVYSKTFFNEPISSVAVADLEGDQLTDIIVTTSRRTYVIGALWKGKVINVLSNKDTANNRYCVGDTVPLRWVNEIGGHDSVSIIFQELSKDSTKLLSRNLLRASVANTKDTVTFRIPVDSTYSGKVGYFVVQSLMEPSFRDSTSIIAFTTPLIILSGPNVQSIMKMNDSIIFRGGSLCLDSISVYFKPDSADSTWTFVQTFKTPLDTFNSKIQIPWIPDLFDCSTTKLDTLVNFKMVGLRGSSGDSILPSLSVAPAKFNFTVKPDTNTACPDRTIRWTADSVPGLYIDSVNIQLSLDMGKSYFLLAKVPYADSLFKWKVGSTFGDSVIVRVCAGNGCMISDTTLGNMNFKDKNIIAPNPFSPPSQMVEIIYSVPADLNVTIRIFDQANQRVAEVVSNQSRLKDLVYCDKWDGITYSGALASNGMYYIQIEQSDGDIRVYPLFVNKK